MEESKSKSCKKREAEALRKLGIELTTLTQKELAVLPLSEVLRRAILDAQAIKSHGAKKRQTQLIGKLMRATDFEAIVAAYGQMLAEKNAKTAGFHQVEYWRDRLISEDNTALTELIKICHPEDIQQLRQLIKQAKAEKLQASPKGAGKALFRYLRECLL